MKNTLGVGRHRRAEVRRDEVRARAVTGLAPPGCVDVERLDRLAGNIRDDDVDLAVGDKNFPVCGKRTL